MKTWTFKPNSSGPQLSAVTYEAPGIPQAKLFFHHGYGEHVGRYHDVFTSLSSQSISTYAYDMRGAGKSEERDEERMKISDISVIVEDFLAFVKEVREDDSSPAVPCFIAGQSLGGLIAATAAADQQDWFSGLLLFSPAMDVEKNLVLKVQSTLGPALEALLPWSRLVAAVKPEDMSEDQQVVKEYCEDPLCFIGNVRVKSARQIEKAMIRLKPRYKHLTLPVYGHHGDQDKCTSLPAHQKFMAEISSQDKTLNVVAGGYHEYDQQRHCNGVIQDLRTPSWFLCAQASEGTPKGGVCQDPCPLDP